MAENYVLMSNVLINILSSSNFGKRLYLFGIGLDRLRRLFWGRFSVGISLVQLEVFS